jgi:hypothetical protein
MPPARRRRLPVLTTALSVALLTSAADCAGGPAQPDVGIAPSGVATGDSRVHHWRLAW